MAKKKKTTFVPDLGLVAKVCLEFSDYVDSLSELVAKKASVTPGEDNLAMLFLDHAAIASLERNRGILLALGWILGQPDCNAIMQDHIIRMKAWKAGNGG